MSYFIFPISHLVGCLTHAVNIERESEPFQSIEEKNVSGRKPATGNKNKQCFKHDNNCYYRQVSNILIIYLSKK